MMSAILKTFLVAGLVSGLAAFSSTAAGAPKPSSRKAAACALGARIMVEQAKGGIVAFDGEASFATEYFKRRIREERPAGWGLAPWQRTLLTKQPPVNLFAACPELAGGLPVGTRMATAQDRAAVERLGQMPRIYIGTIAAPSISADGRTALVYEATRCSGLCGGASLYVYKLVDGRWVKAEPILVMVS